MHSRCVCFNVKCVFPFRPLSKCTRRVLLYVLLFCVFVVLSPLVKVHSKCLSLNFNEVHSEFVQMYFKCLLFVYLVFCLSALEMLRVWFIMRVFSSPLSKCTRIPIPEHPPSFFKKSKQQNNNNTQYTKQQDSINKTHRLFCLVFACVLFACLFLFARVSFACSFFA